MTKSTLRPTTRPMQTQRTALALYAVLLVLPTLVLGWLQWNQIVRDHREELAAVPREAEDAARRLREALDEELARLLSIEGGRPFTHYGRLYQPEPLDDSAQPMLLGSPLEGEHRPRGLQAWFVFDLHRGEDARVDLFFGRGRDERLSDEEQLTAAARELLARLIADGPMRRAARLGAMAEREVPLRAVAASRAEASEEECLIAGAEAFSERRVDVLTSQLHLQYFRSSDGEPRVVAARRVLIGDMPDLRGLTECLHRLSPGIGLVQGFFIDPAWLFGMLPESAARRVLDSSQRYVAPDAPDCCEGRREYHAEVHVLSDLGFEVYGEPERDLGRLRIAVDTARIEARFRSRAWRFFGVAGMLALTLSTGMVLLLRSVRRDLEQAQRTENFVAAVTHELRTPLSSIQLHGEMLLDGWTSDPAKQREYYRRIVRETARLSTLVERVLEKARLTSGRVRPQPGDLAAAVRALEEQLRSAGERDDLAFAIEPDLPPVMLTPESVSSIVVNLVENARKYAPVAEGPGAEPIRVGVRREGDHVVLEVLDRGPGIAPEQASRIFEAFYRVGSESTRTSRGTGLGLHLVALHASAIGGSVRVDPRDGGGSAFRVSFRKAPGET